MTISTYTSPESQTTGKCLLETEGYRILFEFKSLETTQKNVDMMVEFELAPNLGSISVKSIPAFIAIKDLQRLLMYFQKHIARLQEDSDTESDTFLDYGLGFQLQALSGEVRSASDGEFNLRFMLNIGQSSAGASRTYIGGESQVKVENINSFASSLQAALREFRF
jgi:hypothetical protein